MDVEESARILEVSVNINKKDLKNKFRKLVMKYHPDRNKSLDASKKFIDIKEAYETLVKYDSNPVWEPQHFANLNAAYFYGQSANTGSSTFTFTLG